MVAAEGGAARGVWYRETGSGMGATLNAAVGMGAYALTDRATWAAFANKGDHAIVVAGDPALFNQYGVILVNPQRHPHVKAADGQARSEEHTSELQSLMRSSYAVFCLKKNTQAQK